MANTAPSWEIQINERIQVLEEAIITLQARATVVERRNRHNRLPDPPTFKGKRALPKSLSLDRQIKSPISITIADKRAQIYNPNLCKMLLGIFQVSFRMLAVYP
jgi:hypothetical protein